MNKKQINKILKENKEVFEELENYDKTGKLSEAHQAYLLMARIKLKIDKFYEEEREGNILEEVDKLILINEIYDEIQKELPAKYLIAEKLDIDDKEQKILDALRHK